MAASLAAALEIPAPSWLREPSAHCSVTVGADGEAPQDHETGSVGGTLPCFRARCLVGGSAHFLIDSLTHSDNPASCAHFCLMTHLVITSPLLSMHACALDAAAPQSGGPL
jgi:hypothetical protein